MSDGAREEHYSAEGRRLVRHLLSAAESKGVSISALERRMGVGSSVFHKVFRGKVTLQFRHVLLLCDALDLDPRKVFAEFYGLQEVPPAGEPGSQVRAERERTVRLLVRAGLISEEQAEALLRGEE